MEWVVDAKLGKGVYPLKPVFRHWTRDKDGYAKVRRKGFQLVPDFSGTAHSYTGYTMDAAIADCLPWNRTTKREDMLRAYICVSRVRTADDVLIIQPYSPWLFRQGEVLGPHLLMEFWRGNLTEQQVARAWQRDKKKQRSWKEVEDMPHRCWACSEAVSYTHLRAHET